MNERTDLEEELRMTTIKKWISFIGFGLVGAISLLLFPTSMFSISVSVISFVLAMSVGFGYSDKCNKINKKINKL